MSAAFDTLKLSRRLEATGFSHKQATGMAEVLNDALDAELVTRDYLDSRLGEAKTELKDEIAEVKAEVGRLEGKIETESAAIRGELQAESAAIRGELQAESAAIRGELQAESAAIRGELQAESAAIRGQLGRIHWMLLLVIATVALPWIERIVAQLTGDSP